MFKKRIEPSDHCLDCGHDVKGKNYCDNCGQLNNSRKPTLFQLILESVENLFSFDSKFYYSVKYLLAKPGFLTLEYTSGKRMRYTPPIRIFILATIILFTSTSIIHKFDGSEEWLEIRPAEDGPIIAPTDSNAVKVDTLVNAKDLGNLKELDLDAGDNSNLSKIAGYIKQHLSTSVKDGLDSLQMEHSFGNKFIYYHLMKLDKMTMKEFTNYIRGHLLIFLLCFIPFVALMLKFYYIRSNIYYVDHFTFALHTTSAFFVILFLSGILNLIVGDIIFFITITLFAVYLFIALRKFYKQSILKTVLKYILLNLTMGFLMLIFIFLVMFITFFLV